MPLDLASPRVRKTLADRIKADIEAHCVETYADGHRSHLGTSLIGHKCSRYLWYIFRWAKDVVHSGRMYRLFQRGHWEEPHYTAYLRGIGFECWTVDDNGNQYRIATCGGHFGGSMDGAAKAPPKYDIGEPLLLEFKTHNTGSHWTALTTSGVAYQEPKHFVQMSVYGAFQKLRYALYMNTNKNDDTLHVEIVELDWKLAEQSVMKANQIILATVPPPRLSENPTFWECKFCDMHDICHGGKPLAINCRSCKHARPVDGAQWHCNLYNSVIPKETIAKGCPHHLPLQ